MPQGQAQAPATRPAAAQVPLPLPGYYEFDVPAAWRSLEFVSDLHLSPATPRTLEAFETHLRHSAADAIFVLGDLFELWVGDDARHRDFERGCVDLLAEASSRRPMFFMCGNRDFLLGTEMRSACGLLGVPDPTLLAAWGQRVLLTHGDALCLADTAYQNFRRVVRDREWQREFLDHSLDERLRIAAGIRSESEQRRRFDGRDDVDIDCAAAVGWMHAAAAPEMVHGHTHRPGSSVLAPGFKRHVLSDWDLDHADRAEVLRLTRDGFERVPPAGRRPACG
jgi:UDP-2,3-diacylglucosamine hydrolase